MAAGSVSRRPPKRRLVDVRAKSKPAHDPERLTAHSLTVSSSSDQIRERIGLPPAFADDKRVWRCVQAAALLHDIGKIAAGFQQQLLPGAARWGERHEVLSLAYVDLLSPVLGWDDTERLLVATLVATHHRALFPGREPSSKQALSQRYNDSTDWAEAFTVRHQFGSRQVQVTRSVHDELVAWLAQALGAVNSPGTPSDGVKLADRARRVLFELYEEWRRPVSPDRGLSAVLAQGALTLADHAGSAHQSLQTHMPLTADYMQRFPYCPHEHQRLAAETEGHLILVAPTGSGKTEGGLAWAANQLRSMPGQPRLVWTLPYRASLNAARERLRRDLQAGEGERQADIGLLHGALANTLLREALEDECVPGGAKPEPNVVLARQARSRAAAMRLFVQRVRVATPHQLLNGAVAGPTHSSVLLEQANAIFVLDELHAYDPETFGRLCATLALWERLGSRVAILSATLAPQMTSIIEDSLDQRVTTIRAAPGTSPDRHRVVLDDQPMTAPSSLAVLREWLQQGYSVLVVVNTVATAQALFDLLAGDAREASPEDPDAALLLHSRFKNGDRAAIERRLLTRHRERKTGDVARRGGLVVATQTVEVSLQLDFDRGVVEAAPVESVAQRAGRVNRRGLHPEGPVDFRVHWPESHKPYEEAALDAAWNALSSHAATGADTLSEQDVDRLLADAYDTAWGRKWAARALAARDAFARTFLNFDQPFHDRSEFAEKLNRDLDGVEVLHADDVETYRERATGRKGDPLLASELLIPLRYGQLEAFGAELHRDLGVRVVHAPYTARGLERPDREEPRPEPETIL
jgi:CRISPR-associated endonuclease/helicase Cas3